MSEVMQPREDSRGVREAGASGKHVEGRDASAEPEPGRGPGDAPGAAVRRPSFVFFAAVAAFCLLADVASKAWAEVELTRRSPLARGSFASHGRRRCLAFLRPAHLLQDVLHAPPELRLHRIADFLEGRGLMRRLRDRLGAV